MPRLGLELSGACLSFLALIGSASAASCTVPADVELRPADVQRIDSFEAARTRGLTEAMASVTKAESKILTDVVGAKTVPFTEIPMGFYQCRVIKLGGIMPVSIYPYFECVVSEMSTAIEKLTGSQRFLGTLHSNDSGSVFYKGALNYQNEPEPIFYGNDAERDQVGCVLLISATSPRYRMELLLPLYESTFDVIELVPKD
ncbi:DUF4893 domain-containing protein [Devosia sp. WQ 349]|uniref:DUF4893 domain-containing protein n=1 Tax=Devosia sp. WQ 349K1 TaxID=2800329 RepID=UPI0019077C89|nr:DUF4893 domain-containing protein [Devosia sp. WQ 349K1]MBK1795578.1 DUF4893 domain-containing protein [Devosia sp. WQ 349K1]